MAANHRPSALYRPERGEQTITLRGLRQRLKCSLVDILGPTAKEID